MHIIKMHLLRVIKMLDFLLHTIQNSTDLSDIEKLNIMNVKHLA
jgi:hypothetical protein